MQIDENSQQLTPKPENDVKARHLLKTAKRANESGNFRREVTLLEEAIVLMSEVNDHVARRYCSALYKIGEYRASAMVAYSPILTNGGNQDFVKRLQASIEGRGANHFLDVIDRFDL